MSNNNKIPSNEEIIEDLTNDLKSQCTTNNSIDNNNSNLKNNIANNLPNNKIESLKEESEDDDSENEKPNDFIDEIALKNSECNFSEDELNERHRKSLDLKNEGNEQFKLNNFEKSIGTYTEALKLCPTNKLKDRSVLYSNRAACKAKLNAIKSAIEDCSKAIEYDETYLKPYLRRANLYESDNKLDESLADFQKILELDPRNYEAQSAVTRLGSKIEKRNEELKKEMLGKLKDLGNMILNPFGLSTENFKMQQDPNTGSYSINFQQNK